MDNIYIIVFSVVLLYAGYRIYHKYIRKDVPGGDNKSKNSSDIQAGDDYEPYAGK